MAFRNNVDNYELLLPILEAINITRETSGNAMFERIFSKVNDAIREGDVIAKPMKEHSTPGFHPLALFYWVWMGLFPGIMIMSVALTAGRGVKTGGKKSSKTSGASADGQLIMVAVGAMVIGVLVCAMLYMMKMRSRVIDDLVVNMIDVGEETGEPTAEARAFWELFAGDAEAEEMRLANHGRPSAFGPLAVGHAVERGDLANDFDAAGAGGAGHAGDIEGERLHDRRAGRRGDRRRRLGKGFGHARTIAPAHARGQCGMSMPADGSGRYHGRIPIQGAVDDQHAGEGHVVRALREGGDRGHP